MSILVAALLMTTALEVPSLAPEKARFPIGASSKTFGYRPLWLAQKFGFFDKEGLDVQIVVMRGTPITLQALASESIYAANAGTDGIITAVDKGLDFVMVGSLLNNLSMSLVAAKPYKAWDDLRGKVIGSLVSPWRPPAGCSPRAGPRWRTCPGRTRG